MMRSLAKLLYTHNPFYLLSVGFVLFGIRIAFQQQDDPISNAWWMATCFGAYTLLLAATAWSIVHFGKVWDDARTIALLVILLFVAISTSFDHVCVTLPTLAAQVLSAGILFSIIVSEALFHSLKIRFPLHFRIPFYMMLSLFFLFPMFVRHPLWQDIGITDRWRVMMFPAIGGLIMLSLIPAIRAGRRLVSENGTPWSWPLYPWSIFFFLGLGICGRSYMLTLSFQEDQGNGSTFGTYYLIPFATSIFLLLSEIAIVEKLNRLRSALLLSPIVLIAMSLPWRDSLLFETHYTDVVQLAGSPLWTTMLLATAIYCFWWLRGYRAAEMGVLLALLGLSATSPNTIQIQDMSIDSHLPLTLIASMQLILSIRYRSSIRFLTAGTVASGSAMIQMDWIPVGMRVVIAMHGLFFVSLATGFLFADRTARWVSRINPMLMIVCAGCALQQSFAQRGPIEMIVLYIWALAAISVLVWLISRIPIWKFAMMVNASIGVASLIGFAFGGLEPTISRQAIIAFWLGAACFGMGVAISGIKGGLGGRVARWLEREWLKIIIDWKKQMT